MKRTRPADRRAMSQGAEALAMIAAMPLAAMITLSHRLPLLAGALAGSNSWSDPEFLRMTDEKIQAVSQTALAVGGAVAAGQQAIAGYAMAQANANLDLMTQMPAEPTDVVTFGNASLTRLARLAESLGDIGSRSAALGLRPIHRKVTANAKRLAGRKHRAAKGCRP